MDHFQDEVSAKFVDTNAYHQEHGNYLAARKRRSRQ